MKHLELLAFIEEIREYAGRMVRLALCFGAPHSLAARQMCRISKIPARYRETMGAMMKCRIHSEREALAVCQKHEAGFCRDCCECLNIDQCCECLDPRLYCKFRSQCVIWEMSRDRRKKDVEQNF